MLLGKPHIQFSTVVGSYLLLNGPSIGFVWIMRVFLMMAILIPLLHKFLKNRGFIFTSSVIVLILILQQVLILGVSYIDNKVVGFILDETLLYAVGYSIIAILGLKITSFTTRQLFYFIVICAISLTIIIGINNWGFDPQTYKYPPHSQYLVYGIFMSSFLWLLKPILCSLGCSDIYTYLSNNSMWIYLWHIVPVYAISRWSDVPNMWLGRFCTVLIIALVLNYLYSKIIKLLPYKIYNVVK